MNIIAYLYVISVSLLPFTHRRPNLSCTSSSKMVMVYHTNEKLQQTKTKKKQKAIAPVTVSLLMSQE